VKRILLTGGTGQVGWELQRTLAPLGDVVVLDRRKLDLADPDAIRAAIRAARPEFIVNAAGYTAVDQAETEIEKAMRVNGLAPGVMGEEALRLGAHLVHYSTDYVFDGSKDGPYTEDDAAAPLNAYGRSKLAGEQAIRASGCRHLIFRVSWIYGLHGKNFLRTMLRLAQEREELRVVADQFGAPTWSRLIAEATALALARPRPPEGLYHLACAGHTSWHGFSEAILALSRNLRSREPALTAIPTHDYPLPAQRPRNSRLACDRLAEDVSIRLPDWNDALRLCLDS